MDGKPLHHRWFVECSHASRCTYLWSCSLGVFAFSNGVNSLLTNIGKVAMGRLRPHFIPSCFGKYFYKDFCQDPNEWIWNYTCIGETSSAVKEKDGAYDIR